MFSFAGDTVLDPFGGTGTTTLAALHTGRNSISVEIEPRYIELIADRLRSERLAGIIEIEGCAGSMTRRHLPAAE
jgi:DNA modification methylase